jgi:hypothetical protein
VYSFSRKRIWIGLVSQVRTLVSWVLDWFFGFFKVWILWIVFSAGTDFQRVFKDDLVSFSKVLDF